MEKLKEFVSEVLIAIVSILLLTFSALSNKEKE